MHTHKLLIQIKQQITKIRKKDKALRNIDLYLISCLFIHSNFFFHQNKFKY